MTGRIALFVALGAIAPTAPVAARAQSGGAARGGLLLALPTSTRALGLGSAGGAISVDEWATFFSPARLAALRGMSAGAATEEYLAGTQLAAVSAAMPLGAGVLGVGATQLDYGAIDELVPSGSGVAGVPTGRTFTAQDNAFVAGYAWAARPSVHLGIAAEYFGSHVADVSGATFAGSGSGVWIPSPEWSVSAAIQHVGPSVALGATRGALPTTARVSVGAPGRRYGAIVLKPLLEWRAVRGAGMFGVVAAEAIWSAGGGTAVAGRAAYTLAPGSDAHAPVSLGAGVTFGPFTVDYALERFAAVGQVTHRVGLRYARRRVS